jgi:peptidylprolyl isomerase
MNINLLKTVRYSFMIGLCSGGLWADTAPLKQAKAQPHTIQSTPSQKGTVTLPSGLQYTDKKIGTGPTPQTGQTVLVHYTGTLEDGKKFDSSYDRGEPIRFVLGVGQVIKGWDEGLKTMQVGGQRQLTIPSELAYGAHGAGNIIPPHATLLFDVELVGIEE